jgi:small subunit ribosomal protein S6
MSNHYETVFILTPVLSADQAKETVENYKKMLQNAGAKIVNEEHWGMKKLAYPIQKKSTGFYQLFQYEAEGEFIAKLELAFKRDEKVMRFLTVKLDKHAVEYAKTRIEKMKSSAKSDK